MTARFSSLDLAKALGQPPPTCEQRAVIEAPRESILVVAGAGSGKTETMAYRVVWLVANGLVAPEAVLGLTFTRKAAGELAERINQRLRTVRAAGLWTERADTEHADTGHTDTGHTDKPGADLDVVGPTVSTYNAYAGRLVSEHGLRLGVEPDVGLLGEALAWQLADSCATDYAGPMDAVERAVSTVTGDVLALAGQMAEHLRTPEEVEQLLRRVLAEVDAVPLAPRKRSVPPALRQLRGRCQAQLQLLPLVVDYAKRKRDRSVIDFADQVQLAARLSIEYPSVARAERRRYKTVLLDEFQDTSEAQMRLLRSLFAHRTDLDDSPVPVVAVGDPHQSIYGWRGASATTLTAFRDTFGAPVVAGADPDTSVALTKRTPTLPLSTSWRNDESILAAANVVAAELAANTDVDVTTLNPRPGAGPGTVEVARYETHEDEAREVARWIGEYWWADGTGGTDHAATEENAAATGERVRSGRSAAVLCRRRAQFPAVVEALREAGLPVEVVGLGGLLMVPEITDLVALLGAATDPGRADLLMRLLTSVGKLGPRDIDLLGEWARERDRAAQQAAPGVPDRTPPDSSVSDQPLPEQTPADQPPPERTEPDERPEPAGLVEALDDLPDANWRDRHGRGFSEAARSRLTRLATLLRQVRAASAQPLPDLVVVAERALGLEVELLSRPGATPASARAHLDQFAEVVAGFAATSTQATPGDLLAYLAAAAERERGLDMPVTGSAAEAVNVLTVHAAKGLEWDVVAVPGMFEGAFPSYPNPVRARHTGEEWELPVPKDKGWTSDPGALPYPLRGDAPGLPTFTLADLDSAEAVDALDAFAVAGGAHAMLEERRLAYVAFTRAVEALLVTTSVWDRPPAGASTPAPKVTSRFVRELREMDQEGAGSGVTVRHWHPMPDPEAEHPLGGEEQYAWPVTTRHPRTAEADLVREHLADPGRHVETPADADEHERELAEEFDVLLAEWISRRDTDTTPMAVLPDHVTGTDLVRIRADEEAYAADLRRPMPRPPSDAARAGSAFHAWLETRFRAPVLLLDEGAAGPTGGELSLDDLLTGADAQVQPPASITAQLERWKANFLASEWAERVPLHVEFPVEVVIDQLPVRGRIDAVFPRADGKPGVEIVDWKSGRVPPREYLPERSLQLALYRVAYAELNDLPLEQVGAAFFYAADGVTVRPQLPGRDELAEWVASIGR